MTLLITLGFLAVLMMLVLSLAITARTERKAASANADFVRTRLLAESALDRVLAFIQSEFAGQCFPGEEFYRPESGDWAGRGFIASICEDPNASAGVVDALNVKIGDLNLTPASMLDDEVGWLPIRSKEKDHGVDKNVIIGRYSYLIIDDTGKIDPGAVVTASDDEGTVGTRVGTDAAEICLADAGIANPNSYRPAPAGQMPANARWFSLAHIVRALDPTQAQFEKIAETLYPFSYDSQTFWRDLNGDGDWDEGEDDDRLDLTGELTLAELYALFVGPDKMSESDDCAWLNELSNNTWVQEWAASQGVSILQAKQRIAAQIAANIIDYSDADSVPTPAYVDTEGEIQAGNVDFVGCYSVYGVERTWGVTEVAMKVNCEIVGEDPPHTLEGDLNVNPGNSWFEFTMQTPSGQITRDTLHDEGAGFTYAGVATEIKVKPKAQGRTVLLWGYTVTLAPNVQYTITSNDMTVNLRNLNPAAHNWNAAMGHWWCDIRANNVTIDPMPELPEPEEVSLKITPSFKVEVFYPFAVDAFNDDPPGELAVSYKVLVGTQTGVIGTAEASTVVTLDTSAEHDQGTLAWSSAWCSGETTEIAPAFDTESDPPLDGYFVSLAQITAVTLKNPTDDTVDSLPVAAGGEQYRYLCNWSSATVETETSDYYASLSCEDAMQNGRGEVDADFLDYWTVVPDTANLATTDGSDIGNLDAVGYASAEFCDAVVKNGSFATLGELGRVHSFQPMRSLRLWSPDAADEAGHDAAILDLFKIGSDVQTRGRVNINTLQSDVLNALFSNATTVSSANAVAAVLAKRNGGTTFTNIGDVFGGVSGMSGTDKTLDDVEEAAIDKIAGLLSVRQNYFTVLVCAQAIKDVSGVPYTSGGNSVVAAPYYNDDGTVHGLDVKLDGEGNVVRYIDRILAEQKILVTIYRDGFSNQMRVERFEYLNE